jgi:putative ABC transport system permease protein
LNIIEYIVMTLFQIKNNKVRAFLTVLGITIGISSMITVISVGNGGEEMIKKELEKFGVNRGWIIPNSLDSAAVTLDASDEKLLKETVTGINNIASSTYEKSFISKSGKRVVSDIIGTNENLFDIENSVLIEGRSLSKTDIDYSRKVVVLSQEINDELFSNKSAIGEKVEMFGTKYTVIGVKKDEQGIYDSFFSNKCYIPISTLKSLFGQDEIDEISLTTQNSAQLAPALSSSVTLLNNKYGEKSFKFINLQSEMDNAQNIIDIFKTVISAIAAISLLVGGIGIMNIMLVTVKERTKEIGIRKALGAKDHHILNQFLCESIVYSLFGTIIGIILSQINIIVAKKLLDINITMSLQSILLSVIFAFTIGICFGILPAQKASKLDPVCALRQD